MSEKLYVDFSEVISEDLIRRVNLSRFYSYEISSDLGEVSGQYQYIYGGGAQIFLSKHLQSRSANSIQYVYLHEVAHQIAMESGIRDAPHGVSHNCYFGVLLLTMLKRIGHIDNFKIYDINEGYPAGDAPGVKVTISSDVELISRFKFVCEISDEYAHGPLTVEDVAKQLYRRFFIEEWRAKTRTFHDFRRASAPGFQRWGAIALGSLIVAVFLVGSAIGIIQ